MPFLERQLTEAAAWSQHWATGALHSCATSFADNYDGECAAFWVEVLAESDARDQVLDIGTGNGALPLLIVDMLPPDRCPAIHAVDLAAIRPDVRIRSRSNRVTFHPETDAARLPFGEGEFSYVISQFGLEYMDVSAVIAEIGRVTARSCVAAFVMHHPESEIARVSAAELRHCDWLLSDQGLLPAVAQVLPHFVRAGQPPMQTGEAEMARHRYNAAQRKLADLAAGGDAADLLLETAAWANMLLQAARSRGVEFAGVALQQHWNALHAAGLRLRRMLDCAPDPAQSNRCARQCVAWDLLPSLDSFTRVACSSELHCLRDAQTRKYPRNARVHEEAPGQTSGPGEHGAGLPRFTSMIAPPRSFELSAVRSSAELVEWVQHRVRGGEAAAAVSQLQQVLVEQPGHVTAAYGLALALHAVGEIDGALRAIDAHLFRQSDDAAALMLRAKLLMTASRHAEAKDDLQRAVMLRPLQLDLYLSAAQLCIEANDNQAAVALYQRCASQLPNAVEPLLGLAEALEDLGDRAGAVQAYRRALALNPNRGYTIGALLELLGSEADETLVTRAWQAIEGDRATDVAKALIGYGLGKAHQSRKEFDKAFRAWHLANAARRREAGAFDRAKFTRRIDRLMAVFQSAFFQERDGWGAQDSRPVFIVGMPRTGTTLLEQVISAHPECEGLGELPDIAQLAGTLQRQAGPPGWPESIRFLDHGTLDQLAERHIQGLARRVGEGCKRIVDKAPLNFLHLGLIALLFPRARIVWCLRDPRDVCLSIYSENFALQQRHATDLRDLAFYYAEHVRLMAHWKRVLPLTITECRYEDLVRAPRGCAKALIDALGVAWDERCLGFHDQQRSVRTPSRWQVRKPIYASSVGRWRSYAQHLGPLVDELARCGIETEPGALRDATDLGTIDT